MKAATLSVVVGALILVSTAAQAQPPDHPPPPRYRVIFNCDGFGGGGNGSVADYVQRVFGPIENSDVDALFWCDGAGGNTALYDSDVLELNGARIGKVRPGLLQWIKEGNDPPKVVVREAKKRGLPIFYSFRLNDTHDFFLEEELPTFKIEHPEWTIGNMDPNYPYHPVYPYTSLDFSVPQVRWLKYRVVKEIFRKYDFDGIEIDFMRSPPHFKPGTEPSNAHILTEFLRRIRWYLNKKEQQRGRPIYLAARVDENLEACRLDGFDVKTWMKEGLIDILSLGSGTIDIEVEKFKQLAEGTNVRIYPCLYGWPSRYNPIPAEMVRGLALNYWNQGADGLYLFNWYSYSSRYQIPLLSEIGNPEDLLAKPLMFAVDRGQPQTAYPHNWLQAVLPVELDRGELVRMPIRVGTDLTASPWDQALLRVDLRVECENLLDSDKLQVTFNGKTLSGEERDGGVIMVRVAPEQIKVGENEVVLHLASQQVGAEPPVTVKGVEMLVDYP